LNHAATPPTTEPGTPAPDAPISVPAAQPSTFHKIFIGKDGLRAGWSLLIFIALFAAFAACVRFAAHRLFPSAPHSAQVFAPSLALILESIQFLMVFVAACIISKI